MSTTPEITATVTVTNDGSAVVEFDGRPPQRLQADDLSQARHQAVELVIMHARHNGQPIALLARDGDTSHLLEIHPDGSVHPAETAPSAQHGLGSAPPRVLACPPTTSRPRPLWVLVIAAAATAVAVGTALWLRPANHSAVTTTQTPPSASTASPDAAATPTRAAAAFDGDTLGVTVAALSEAPHPMPLPVSVAHVAWDGAATWQEGRTRQERRTTPAIRPVATWTEGPSTQVAPVRRPVAPPPPPPPDPSPAAPLKAAQPTRPQVVMSPDPVSAELRPAPQRPVGPAMPDQPTNPTDPD